MTDKILVSYASKYGATAEIAEKIAQLLEQAGLEVELIPVKKVKQIDGYRAVIVRQCGLYREVAQRGG